MPPLPAQPVFGVRPVQHDFTLSSQSAQSTAATTDEYDTPTKSKKAGSAKKRKIAAPNTPKQHQFDNVNDPSGGYGGSGMGVNLVQMPELNANNPDRKSGVTEE
jgi:hypothetical protein